MSDVQTETPAGAQAKGEAKQPKAFFYDIDDLPAVNFADLVAEGKIVFDGIEHGNTIRDARWVVGGQDYPSLSGNILRTCGVDFQTEFGLPLVRECQPAEVNQVFLNLTLNACLGPLHYQLSL